MGGNLVLIIQNIQKAYTLTWKFSFKDFTKGDN